MYGRFVRDRPSFVAPSLCKGGIEYLHLRVQGVFVFIFSSSQIDKDVRVSDQADRDNAVSGLLTKVSKVYSFATEEEGFAKIESMIVVYGTIAQQTPECADFIVHYSETKSICELISQRRRLRLNVISSLHRDKVWQEHQMPRSRASLRFSRISCKNFEIERLVTPL